MNQSFQGFYENYVEDFNQETKLAAAVLTWVYTIREDYSNQEEWEETVRGMHVDAEVLRNLAKIAAGKREPTR